MLEPEATRQQEQTVLNNTEATPNIIYIYDDEGAGENSVKYVLDTLRGSIGESYFFPK